MTYYMEDQLYIKRYTWASKRTHNNDMPIP